jgi:VWFA-related protein
VVAVAAAQAPQQPRHVERVEVSRVVVDARVVDDDGKPVRGLGLDDFKIRIDGRPARIESVRWVGEGGTRTVGPGPVAAAVPDTDTEPPGRLIVFLFQKDLEATRIWGLMRMLTQAQGFLNTLTPDDRVAILSFDSHLKIWVDFTSDRKRLGRILARGVLFERPSTVDETSAVSLVGRLKTSEGERTFSIEKALRLIAEALEPLTGSKSVVLFGYGFGRLSLAGRSGPIEATSVTMENGYEEAAKALLAARVAVFSLDVTRADYHSLEVGLQLVAEQTGGFYARTHEFPERAMRYLAGALAGYYVLIVEKPDLEPGMRGIDVELTRRKGTVLVRSEVWIE